jgi:hypothetical protein
LKLAQALFSNCLLLSIFGAYSLSKWTFGPFHYLLLQLAASKQPILINFKAFVLSFDLTRYSLTPLSCYSSDILLYTIHSERLYGVITYLDVRFVDVIGKQPTDNIFADGGKPRIFFAGRVNFA